MKIISKKYFEEEIYNNYIFNLQPDILIKRKVNYRMYIIIIFLSIFKTYKNI